MRWSSRGLQSADFVGAQLVIRGLGWALVLIGVLVASGCPKATSPSAGGDLLLSDAGSADLVGADLAGADLTGAPFDLAGDAAAQDAGVCSPACGPGFLCCNSVCINPANDIFNCGVCGKSCTGAHPYCDNGTCATDPPCNSVSCLVGFCCGNLCCTDTELCCDVNGPGPISGPRCFDPQLSGGTCPGGCPACQ